MSILNMSQRFRRGAKEFLQVDFILDAPETLLERIIQDAGETQDITVGLGDPHPANRKFGVGGEIRKKGRFAVPWRSGDGD
jgi:hypothetical protein